MNEYFMSLVVISQVDILNEKKAEAWNIFWNLCLDYWWILLPVILLLFLLHTAGFINVPIFDKIFRFTALSTFFQKRCLNSNKRFEKEFDELLDIGRKMLGAADYLAALEYADKAEQLARKRGAVSLEKKSGIARLRGMIFGRQGEYVKALCQHEIALKNDREKYGESNRNVAIDYNNLAIIHDQIGEFSKALSDYEKALRIFERQQGEFSLEVATAHNNIGIVYYEMKDYPKALEQFEKALQIRRKKLGNKHPKVATIYNNMGNVYGKMSDFSRALSLHTAALEIRKEKLGCTHPSTAASHNNIGDIYRELGKNSEAFEELEEALKIQENQLGMFHPDTLGTYYNLSLNYHAVGDQRKSLQYALKAWQGYNLKFGSQNYHVQDALNNLEEIYRSAYPNGDFEEWIKHPYE